MIKQPHFFIYWKKVVNLCPILRLLCNRGWYSLINGKINIIKTINYYAK